MSESETPGLDRLRELNVGLGELLDDPQPGLFTWMQFLSNICLEIADFAGYGKVSDAIKLRSLK